ncbi:MAG: malto-oligosyltrehalose synthase [Gemmatimonas sp.]|nr:malto-oligosyltrehalose synthase [Gemmatimonas sp.]
MQTNSSDPARPRAPLATYRLQLNLDFTFRDATALVPYLRDLGVSDLYASPYLKARPGSLHGYDISDHRSLNSEVGSSEDHDALTGALRDAGMGHLLDLVPNHMGVEEPSNRWWMDVLENGPSSPYAPYFDVEWNPQKPELIGKILLPVLGDQFGTILEQGELRLRFTDGRFRILYHEQEFPVSSRSSSLILRTVLSELREHAPHDELAVAELESIVTALEHLPPRDRSDEASISERRRESIVSRRRLLALYGSSSGFRAALERTIAEYNGTVGDPSSFDKLERVLDDQAYRLAYWRVAVEEINYRRFVDINNLAGIRVERSDVFDATHSLILQFVAERKVTGLRIDHPDGLFDPRAYLERLQAEVSSRIGGKPFYVVVEKILTGEERVPEKWPVAGTVGYDFLNRVNGLYIAHENERAITEVYERFTGDRIDFNDLAYHKKKLILRVALASELNVLGHLLNRISEKIRRSRDFTRGSLTDALRETIACLPVYRTYIEAIAGHVGPMDAEYVEHAIRDAIRRNRTTSPSIFGFIQNILLLRWPGDLDAEVREEHALFVMKFQQLTGPVMAKGVEDTSFYIYNRLISLNEVGGETVRFGVRPPDLHRWLEERVRAWPLGMNSSSTHDTKRSEDVRARINVLSEMPGEWEERVRQWAEMNAKHKVVVDGDPVPDANVEYLFYQTLIGTWPIPPSDERTLLRFRERIQQYMEKATREAKLHTSWITPNEAYDAALQDFIGRVLDFTAGWEDRGGFLADLAEFQRTTSECGMVNSLSQTLLKLTAPGVPDLFQGQELWDLSLVDPDNRQPVDYERRRSLLEELMTRRRSVESRAELARELVDSWADGRIKLLLTHVALELRRERAPIFLEGDYIPLDAEGERAEHLFAFARRHPSGAIVAALPRLPLTFRNTAGVNVTEARGWGDTRLIGPADVLAGAWRNSFTGRDIRLSSSSGRATLSAGDLLGGFPVGLLVRMVNSE